MSLPAPGPMHMVDECNRLHTAAAGSPPLLPLPLQCCCFDGGAGIVTYSPTDTCTCARVVETSQIWATVVLRQVLAAPKPVSLMAFWRRQAQLGIVFSCL